MTIARSIKVRKLAKFAIPALVGSLALIATAAPAHASVNSTCDTVYHSCTIGENMGSGFCSATIYQSNSSGADDATGEFAKADYTDYDTGYSCHFWVERDVNWTGWYQIGGTTSLASSGSAATGATSANYWDDGFDGYMAEVCFQFDWGSSLGAAHCSEYVTYG
jgi:hypothetical protein